VAVCRDLRASLGLAVMPRRFPPPWSVEESDAQLQRTCFTVWDQTGCALLVLHH